MPNIKQIAKSFNQVRDTKRINWHPGHMYGGMQAMIGKLNTVDCVIEVHDARIPFIGRNKEFRQHLGLIKPHVLVLNKSDLADLSRWDDIETRLRERGDNNVILSDLTGSPHSHATRGYTKLMENVMKLVNKSDRHNRHMAENFKVMVVGIPNVGKSTLINRLRQYYLGRRGEAVKTGSEAGVTRHVENLVKICSRPPMYSLDTPGVLEPSATRNHHHAMRLALCSTINDKVLNPEDLASYLLKYLNDNKNYSYVDHVGLAEPTDDLKQLCLAGASKFNATQQVKAHSGSSVISVANTREICWRFIRSFRKGLFGLVMFD